MGHPVFLGKNICFPAKSFPETNILSLPPGYGITPQMIKPQVLKLGECGVHPSTNTTGPANLRSSWRKQGYHWSLLLPVDLQEKLREYTEYTTMWGTLDG